MDNKKQIFGGIKVLDFCRVIAGSFATTILGDLGAEIIKIEQPVIGDALRKIGPFVNDESHFFMAVNRNKKSISIDFKKEEGLNLIKKMIPHFDVVTENFKPGVMEKLGLGYEDVKKIKKEIIYLSVSGYGHKNKYSHRQAYDVIVQAESGLTSLNGFPNPGTPMRSPLSVADYTAGTNGALAVSAALYHLKNTGEGQYIDVGMYDTLLSLMDNTFMICEAKNDVIKTDDDLYNFGLKSTGNRHPDTSPHGIYKTSDGYIAHTSLTDEMWNKFLQIMGKENCEEKEKFKTLELRKKNWKELDEFIEKWTQTLTSDEAIKILRENKLPCGKARNIHEVYNDSYNEERKVFVEVEHPKAGKVKIPNIPIKFSETPTKIKSSSPNLGEDYMFLVEGIGLETEYIDELIKNKILYINKKG